MKKNIFLTGPPSIGKTTIIKKVIAKLKVPCNGFYTEEERISGKRIGFKMKTVDGKSGYLAHQDIESDYHIHKYGVSIENIKSIAIPSIRPVLGNVIILDEIGKMECFSLLFKNTVIKVLDSPNIVIGTITLGGGEFIESIKMRDDIEVITVTENNRDKLPELIVEKIMYSISK